jgi:hypothetical protein
MLAGIGKTRGENSSLLTCDFSVGLLPDYVALAFVKHFADFVASLDQRHMTICSFLTKMAVHSLSDPVFSLFRILLADQCTQVPPGL